MAVLLANNAASLLAGPVNEVQKEITVSAGTGARFPSPSGGDWFPITLEYVSESNVVREILRCTARTGDVLTVMRGQEATVAQTFPAGAAAELRTTKGVMDTIVNEMIAPHLVPSGVITLWSGAVASVPTGWSLCNGKNGTPDLRDRFIVGAGGGYNPGDKGGAASVALTTAQLPAHNHSMGSSGAHSHTASTDSAGNHSHTASTDSAGNHSHTASTDSAGNHSHTGGTNTTGSHNHTFPLAENERNAANEATFGTNIQRTGTTSSNGAHSHSVWTNSGGAHTHTVSVNSDGDHTHTVSVDSAAAHSHSVSVGSNGAHTHSIADTGSGAAHENRPPYYALAYIMKL